MERKKSALRKHYQEVLQQFVQKNSIEDLSQRVLELLGSLRWSSFKTVAIYRSLVTEVPVESLSQKYPEISWVYPRVFDQRNFGFVFTSKETLFKKNKGFYEPDSTDICPPEKIDLFLVPGLSFDRQMKRVGRGLGFYDQILQKSPQSMKVGVCWSAQVDSDLPHEPHDQKMHALVTENWLLYSNNFFQKVS